MSTLTRITRAFLHLENRYVKSSSLEPLRQIINCDPRISILESCWKQILVLVFRSASDEDSERKYSPRCCSPASKQFPYIAYETIWPPTKETGGDKIAGMARVDTYLSHPDTCFMSWVRLLRSQAGISRQILNQKAIFRASADLKGSHTPWNIF
ncbi:hypothetical protein HNY73_009950 [Argiope bruennichi]|uniref:Uncharacterized protein n=1 Tax=Argiope bruennichi TaxID=94029 RepID=A0A8T0F9D5_ARGBR|nr:hypothetical protein HNY73_009950 [Argiope bruennichi]